MPAALSCCRCQRSNLTEADFSKLSLHILSLNPASRTSLQCAMCLSAAREAASKDPPAAPPPVTATRPPASNDGAAAMALPSGQFSASDAYELGEAILETSTIAPSEAGSDDDLEEDLADAGLDGDDDDDDVQLEQPDVSDTPANGLTSAALAEHEQRTEAVERRQFNWYVAACTR